MGFSGFGNGIGGGGGGNIPGPPGPSEDLEVFQKTLVLADIVSQQLILPAGVVNNIAAVSVDTAGGHFIRSLQYSIVGNILSWGAAGDTILTDELIIGDNIQVLYHA